MTMAAALISQHPTCIYPALSLMLPFTIFPTSWPKKQSWSHGFSPWRLSSQSCAVQKTILSIWVSFGRITNSFVSKFYQVSDNLTYQKNIRWKIDLNGELFEFLRRFVGEYFFRWPRQRRWYLRTITLFLSWIFTYIEIQSISLCQAKIAGQISRNEARTTVDNYGMSHFLPLMTIHHTILFWRPLSCILWFLDSWYDGFQCLEAWIHCRETFLVNCSTPLLSWTSAKKWSAFAEPFKDSYTLLIF